jgi:hypothetical protein
MQFDLWIDLGDNMALRYYHEKKDGIFLADLKFIAMDG